MTDLGRLGLVAIQATHTAHFNTIDIGSVVLSLSSIHPLRHLQTLKLCEFIIVLSNKISLQLTKITLLGLTGCRPSTWGVLGSLTNLRILKVVKCILRINFNESSFCQLEVLKMAKVTDSEWTMENAFWIHSQQVIEIISWSVVLCFGLSGHYFSLLWSS